MKIKSHIAFNNAGVIFNPYTKESFILNQFELEILKLLKNNETKIKIKDKMLLKFLLDDITFEKAYLNIIKLLNKNHLIDDSRED